MQFFIQKHLLMGSKHKTSCSSYSFSSSRLLGTGLLQIFQVLFVIRIHFGCFNQSSRFFSLRGRRSEFFGVTAIPAIPEIGKDPHLDLILAEFCSELVFLGLLARCNLRFPVLPKCNVLQCNQNKHAQDGLETSSGYDNIKHFPRTLNMSFINNS